MSSNGTDTTQITNHEIMPTTNPNSDAEDQIKKAINELTFPELQERLAKELIPGMAVAFFMLAGKQKMPSAATMYLYHNLIKEELDETAQAQDYLDRELRTLNPDGPSKEVIIKGLTEYFDGIFDTMWVGIGFCLACGIPFEEVWAEGTLSNLKKIDPLSGIIGKNEIGKIMKPTGWKKPDFRQFAERAYKNLYE